MATIIEHNGELLMLTKSVFTECDADEKPALFQEWEPIRRTDAAIEEARRLKTEYIVR